MDTDELEQTNPILVFDLDRTLWFYGKCAKSGRSCIVLYPDVRQLLQELSATFKLAVSSYHRGGEKLLNQLGLAEYFAVIRSEPIQCKKCGKQIHLLDIAKQINTKPENLILFDDKIENINHAKSIGAKAIHVKTGGVTQTHVLSALSVFKMQHRVTC